MIQELSVECNVFCHLLTGQTLQMSMNGRINWDHAKRCKFITRFPISLFHAHSDPCSSRIFLTLDVH